MRTQKNLFPDDKLCSLLSLFTSESKSGLAIGRSRSYLLAQGHSTTCRGGGAHHDSESQSRKSVKAISRSGIVHQHQHGVWPERGFYLSGPAHPCRHRGKRHLRYAVQVVRHGHRSTGTQIGSTITKSTVMVTSGVFTVDLDFGSSAFPGAGRFLGIRSEERRVGKEC